LNTRWNRNEVENPTLEVPLGSEVRIVLENDDPIPHNFAMVDFDIRTEILDEGDRLTVMFTADEAGRFAYFCPIHPGLMDGIIVVGP
jgi:plastocyanin